MNGQFEFFNVDEMETMATAEHFMATDVEWDPTGRWGDSSSSSTPWVESTTRFHQSFVDCVKKKGHDSGAFNLDLVSELVSKFC